MRLCAKCHIEKPLSNYAYKNKSKGWLLSYCMECNRMYQRWHYQKYHDDYRVKRSDRRKKVRKENRQKLLEYFCLHPCIDCGEKDYQVLEFDHVRGEKRDNVATMFSGAMAWETMLIEISKCEVRCANCHKRKTAKQFQWYSNN